MEFETAIVLTCTFGSAVGASLVAHRALTAEGTGRRARPMAALLPVAWWFAVVVAAWNGSFAGHSPGGLPPFLFGWGPALAAMGIWAVSVRVRRFVESLSPERLVGFQVFRLVGVAMFVAGWRGSLPSVFAATAGFGGVLTGIAAPWVARELARRKTNSVVWAHRWNALGLADIALAMVVGGLSGSGPASDRGMGIPDAAATAFPLVVTPAFLIPLALLGHFAVWRTLRLRT